MDNFNLFEVECGYFTSSFFIIRFIKTHFRPNFMIMDEPTNHLDVESVEALGKALLDYKVCLLSYYLAILF